MSRSARLIYWIATGWLCLGILSSAVAQLFDLGGTAESLAPLGYPVYFLTLLSCWKIAGVMVLLLPVKSWLKEWAYAGIFFAMSGAVISHVLMQDPVTEILPSLLLLGLTVLSKYFLPRSRVIV